MRAALLALLLASAAAAQPTGAAELLEAMTDAVERFDYETAEARAREALGLFDALTPDQLVTVHATLGTLLHARSQPVEARRHFEAALSLDPGLRLDPVLVSPKTVEFFEEVRAEAEVGRGPAAPAALRYVVLEDRRPAAALRSLMVPGWGQAYKGDRTKSWAFGGAALLTVAGVAVAETARASARDAYLAASTPDEAERLYPAYDRWHRARSAFVLGAGAVWAAATLDALVTGGPAAPEGPALGLGPARLTLAPAPLGLSLRARF